MFFLLWRPGWWLAPWYVWLLACGTFALNVGCWIWLFWQLAKRRYLVLYALRMAQGDTDADEDIDTGDSSTSPTRAFRWDWDR